MSGPTLAESDPTLTEILRDPGAHISSPVDSLKMCKDAADEIDRLRAEIVRREADRFEHVKEKVALRAENEELKADRARYENWTKDIKAAYEEMRAENERLIGLLVEIRRQEYNVACATDMTRPAMREGAMDIVRLIDGSVVGQRYE